MDLKAKDSLGDQVGLEAQQDLGDHRGSMGSKGHTVLLTEDVRSRFHMLTRGHEVKKCYGTNNFF